MDKNIFENLVFVAVLLFFSPLILPAAELQEEQQLLAVLKSKATLQEKDAACAQLKRIGTARSVLMLAELLTDEDLSHSARYALESMPVPEAGLALVEALDKTGGLIRMGIIHSLGERLEKQAVPIIAGLLADTDPNVASAAAAALGRIGSSSAVQSLFTGLSDITKAGLRNVILDALLAAAYQALGEGGRDSASAIYEKLYKIPAADHVRVAGYRGMIAAADPRRALELVKIAIQGDDGTTQMAALEMAGKIAAPEVTEILCETLALASPRMQVALIEALRQRGDTTAAPTLIAMTKSSDLVVRVAAIGALGDLGDDTTVAMLVEAASSANETEKKAARQSLLVLRHGNVTKTLVSQLRIGKRAAQAEAVRALAGRGDEEAAADLLTTAWEGSDSAREAACLALGQLADKEHIAPLVRLVSEARDETRRARACDALRAVCQRLKGWDIHVDAGPIVAGLAGGNSKTRAALLQATTALEDARLRAALRSALSDPVLNLREAAVLALCDAHDPELLPDLLNLAQQGADQTQQVKAIRGYLRLATDMDTVQLSIAQRVKALREILPLILRPEEKWLMLSGLGKIADPEALELSLTMLDDAATRAEAAQAVTQIADSISRTHMELARTALERVLNVATEPDQRNAAETVLDQINTMSGRPLPVAFRRLKVDGAFRSEGVAVADFNRDGRLDIATGNILYLGPDWKPQPMLTAPKEYKPEGYSEEFLCFAEDTDADSWADLIVVGFPGAKTRWLRNPGQPGGPWKEFLAIEKTGNESPDWLDVDKDGRKELIFVSEQGMAFARPAEDSTKPWAVHVIASPNDPRPGHGLGMGDINGDGRNDLVCPEGWWEAPPDPSRVPWMFHKDKLGFEAPAQMPVFDMDGDGDPDVASSGAHRYGLWWYEKTAEGWKPHEIDHSISQLHALHVADINRDGLPDLVTGKRFWAHREGDEGIDDPAVVCWFELKREDGNPSWIRHDIDSDSGVGLHFQVIDINRDGLLDIVTSNKKGVYVFMQEKR